MSYGDRLDEAMKAAARDRKALATHLGISVQAVGQVLTGRTKALDAANHMRAAAFLRCDPHWLATGTGHRQQGMTEAWPFRRITPKQWATLAPALADRIETYAEGVLAAASDNPSHKSTGTHG